MTVSLEGKDSGLEERLRESCSFAPLGLAHSRSTSHGLRRGLHSYAASRLKHGAGLKHGECFAVTPKLWFLVSSDFWFLLVSGFDF
jgi:hypothetical protein